MHPSQVKDKKYIFCNKKCFNKFQIKRITKFCEICGKPVPRPPKQFGKHVYCSRECTYKGQAGEGHWNYGKPWDKKHKKVLKDKLAGFKPSKEQLENQMKNTPRGENHSCWEGGKSFIDYPTEFTERLKEQIRENFGRICQGKGCGIPEAECFRKLDVHHIDYIKKNCSEVNLIPLCVKCNVKVNRNRKYWEEYFTQLMISKINFSKERKNEQTL